MRYFMIYADKANCQPRFLDWYPKIGAGKTPGQIYMRLDERDHFKVELGYCVPFMDIISHPCFMVSKEFADLIRLYSPETEFKYATLCDRKRREASLFHIPILPELMCLDERSELSRDKSEILKGILKQDRIGETPIFRVGGVNGFCVAAGLDLVESVYRREVRGMRIKEFMVY